MKSKKIILTICITFIFVVTIIALIILSNLGAKVRTGYLTDFNLNVERTLKLNNLENMITNYIIDDKLDEESIKNYIFTNENITNYAHQFRIRYYDKVFRNSDIYGVYPDLSNLPDYMKNAEMEYGGSPFGNFTYDKRILNIEKIDNISYILKLKYYLVFVVIILLASFILYYLIEHCKKFRELLTCNNITRLDWAIFIVISVFCFLSFQQGDMFHTVTSSFTYLNGHILDFYKYNTTLEYIKLNNYMPSTYILFAIWNFPLKLLFSMNGSNIGLGVIYYNKIFTTLFYIACAIIMYKICKTIGFDDKKSKITSFLWLTTPLAIYSQFIFGQYDIFTVFFTLLGVYFYFKNDDFKFALFFGIALTFKYFPAFIFIILLIYREKNIIKIIKQCAIFIIPFAIELLIYISDSAFREGVFGFVATSFIFALTFKTEYGMNIKIFLMFWIFICGYTYFNEVKNKSENEKYIFYYLSLVSFMLFGLSYWHPQWVIFITPFLVFGTVINKKYNIFMLLDIFLMLFFISFTVNRYVGGLDARLLSRGIFSSILLDIDIKDFHLYMRDIFRDSNSISYTFFSGLLLLNALFKHPKYDFDNINEDISDSMPLIRLRLVIGIMIFIIPCFILALS